MNRQQINATVSHYSFGKREIFYASVGEDHFPALLFIHGEKETIASYVKYFSDVELLQHFSLYAIDRPGHGSTAGSTLLSVKKQADMMLPLVESIHRIHQPLILAGTGFGSSLAIRIAALAPSLVQGIILIDNLFGKVEKPENGLMNQWKARLQSFIQPSHKLVLAEREAHLKEEKALKTQMKNMHVPVVLVQSGNFKEIRDEMIKMLEIKLN